MADPEEGGIHDVEMLLSLGHCHGIGSHYIHVVRPLFHRCSSYVAKEWLGCIGNLEIRAAWNLCY